MVGLGFFIERARYDNADSAMQTHRRFLGYAIAFTDHAFAEALAC
jgi:hypothetical protein